MVYVIQPCRQLSSENRMELQFHPGPITAVWRIVSYMDNPFVTPLRRALYKEGVSTVCVFVHKICAYQI
jgi:hypothetical protein